MRDLEQKALEPKKLLTRFFSFGIDCCKHNIPGRNYREPSFFKDLAEFYLANYFTFHFADLFPLLMKLLSEPSERISQIIVYIIKVIHYTK